MTSGLMASRRRVLGGAATLLAVGVATAVVSPAWGEAAPAPGPGGPGGAGWDGPRPVAAASCSGAVEVVDGMQVQQCISQISSGTVQVSTLFRNTGADLLAVQVSAITVRYVDVYGTSRSLAVASCQGAVEISAGQARTCYSASVAINGSNVSAAVRVLVTYGEVGYQAAQTTPELALVGSPGLAGRLDVAAPAAT